MANDDSPVHGEDFCHHVLLTQYAVSKEWKRSFFHKSTWQPHHPPVYIYHHEHVSKIIGMNEGECWYRSSVGIESSSLTTHAKLNSVPLDRTLPRTSLRGLRVPGALSQPWARRWLGWMSRRSSSFILAVSSFVLFPLNRIPTKRDSYNEEILNGVHISLDLSLESWQTLREVGFISQMKMIMYRTRGIGFTRLKTAQLESQIYAPKKKILSHYLLTRDCAPFCPSNTTTTQRRVHYTHDPSPH